MFEVAELGRKLTKTAYARQEARLRPALLAAQREHMSSKFAVILLVSGVDGAGKGETVNLLSDWMDPRGLQVNVFGEPTQEERERPPYWRFWMSLPPRGRIGVFFGSWYTEPIVGRALKQTKKSSFQQSIQEILNFERQVADDGALIVKLWFHLSKKAQERRLRALEGDKLTRWRVTRQDWKRFKIYDRFREISETVLKETSTGYAPWTVIEGEDHRWRSMAAVRALHDALRAKLDAVKAAPAPRKAPAPETQKGHLTVLDGLDPKKSLTKPEYEKKLELYQGRLFRLARRASLAGLSTVVLYEGWDAAGKGGNIRRLTQGMDARNYRLVPIAAPTDEERAHPYLWRFWRALPRSGRVTIFDRSWYGRVLVERVEGFCSEEDWRRAYAEINSFEEQLHNHGTAIVKVWLHITKDEQLRRFHERRRLEYKRFKITAEDWRNRKMWDAYLAAVDEMVERTSTPFAPWTLVEGNCKYHARIKTLQTLCERLEGTLKG